MLKPTEFCIVGLGLLGGSYAMALTKKGHRVTAIDVRGEAIAWALERGIIADGTVDDGAHDGDMARLLGAAGAVVLGLYPADLAPWLRARQGLLRPGALVTDVCGVKRAVVGTVQGFLRPDVEYIPSHPMAGREVSGVENADDRLFAPANFLITPTAQNTSAAVAWAKELAAELGFAHVSVLSCEEHDRMIGYVSQLTHAIAVSLMNANSDPHLVDYTGDSFRDLTRIAKINEELWSQLFFANRDMLTAEIEQFEAALTDLKAKLAAGDEAGLKELFRRATARRRLFDRPAPGDKTS